MSQGIPFDIEKEEEIRPVRKIAEHLTDAQFHMVNVKGLTDFERSEFVRLCNDAWNVINGRKV